MYIERRYEQHLVDLVIRSTCPHNVLLIEGARQTGKTTLVKQVLSRLHNSIIKNIVLLNLEQDKLLRKEIDACQNFEDFTLRLSKEGFKTDVEQVLFIDEAQESEQLGSFVRFMKENWPKTRTILSGSSMTRLFRQDARIPVGRIHRFLVQPLSFYEFISHPNYLQFREKVVQFDHEKPFSDFLHKQFLELIDLYLNIGGLPEVVTSFFDKNDYLKIRKEILVNQEDDFIRKVRLENINLFTDGLRGIANHIGGVSKYTQVSTSLSEAKQICNLLASWKLIHEVEQHTLVSTTTLQPKRYIYDVGIAQLLRNQPCPNLSIINTLNSALRTQLGGLFENLILITLKEFQTGDMSISGWKEGAGNKPEVDFVIKYDKIVVPIECKATLKVNQRNFSSLKCYLTKADLRTGILVSAAPFEIFEDKQFRFINIPIYLFSASEAIKCARMY